MRGLFLVAEEGLEPPTRGVRRSLNAPSNNAGKQPFGANKSAGCMVEHQLVLEPSKAENVAQQPKLFTAGRHENYAKIELKSFVK